MLAHEMTMTVAFGRARARFIRPDVDDLPRRRRRHYPRSPPPPTPLPMGARRSVLLRALAGRKAAVRSGTIYSACEGTK